MCSFPHVSKSLSNNIGNLFVCFTCFLVNDTEITNIHMQRLTSYCILDEFGQLIIAGMGYFFLILYSVSPESFCIQECKLNLKNLSNHQLHILTSQATKLGLHYTIVVSDMSN